MIDTIGNLMIELNRIKPETPIYFDFCDHHPDLDFFSYRGDYSHAAIGYCSDLGIDKAPTCGQLLALLKSKIGGTMEGYKGGTYSIGLSTKIWVSDVDRSSGTAIKKIKDLGYQAIICTKYID